MRRAALSTLEVASDPRIELLGVVQALASGASSEKASGLGRRFSPWRRHPVVEFYRRRVEATGGEESYGLIILFLTAPPELRWNLDRNRISTDFIALAGGAEELDRYLDALRDFASASGFMEYYARFAARFERHRLKGERRLAGLDCLRRLEDYVGESLNARYRVIWTLLYRPGRLTSYIIPYPYQGPRRAVPGPFEIFTIPTREEREDRRTHYLWTEPLYIPIERLFSRHEAEFAELAPDAKARLVDAIAWRLTLNTRGRERPPEADVAAASAKMNVLSRALCRRLEEYEEDRRAYPTLGDFFPRLLDVFPRRGRARAC